MTRSSALLLAAVVLLVAVCGQHTASAAVTTNREWPLFITVAGSVGQFSNYTRLQGFCSAMTTVPGILGCQIFSVKPSPSVANAVQIGAYFYTSATITTSDATIAAINTAFPVDTNAGGIIRSAATTAGVKNTDSPGAFTYLPMHLRFYFRGTATGTSTPLTAINLRDKILTLDLAVAATLQLVGANDVAFGPVAFDNNDVYLTSVRVTGYWTNRNTMYNDILTKLRDSSGTGAFILIVTEDVTQATADANIGGYDALAATPANLPYVYVITLTTNVGTAAFTQAAITSVTNDLYDFLYPNVDTATTAGSFSLRTAVADGTAARLPVEVRVASSDNLLRILQQLNDEIYSGNTTRATFGGIAFTGIYDYAIAAVATSSAFRIPTTDFPLQQRYKIPVESLLRFNNQTAAVNELCAQLIRRTPNVTACYIETIATAAPAKRTASAKFATLAVDSALSFVLNATDAAAAVRMKRNVQLTLQSAAPILGLNFSDTNNIATVREELWRPRDQKHAMFTEFYIPDVPPPNPNPNNLLNLGQIINTDSVQERIDLFSGATALFVTQPYPATDMSFWVSRTDINVTTTPVAGLNIRAWVIAPRVITPLGLYLRQAFAFLRDTAPIFRPTTGATVTRAGVRNLNGTGEAFAVTTRVLLTYTEPATATDRLGYVANAKGNAAVQDSFEAAAAAAFTEEASLVFDAAGATGNDPAAPLRIFTLTAQSTVSIIAQHSTVLNFTTGSTFANYPLRTPGYQSAVLTPELDYRVFPAVPATPATAAPVTAPNAPATAPAAPVAPSVFAPGAINGVQVGADFFIIIPPAVDAAALCAAILAQGAGAPYNIRTCTVRSSETTSALPAAGTKFAQQVTYQRVVVVLTTADPTSANSLVNNMIIGVNNKSFLRGFNIADINLVALPAIVPTSTNQPQPAIAPTVPPATNGTFTTVDIYIVILGTALDSAGQAALNNECGNLLGGGATCVTKNIEQTTAARKMTTQASALRLTETVRAPASTYPSANAIVARLQAAVRSNNNRLGGQQVVSIATIGNGRSAATRAAPALLALLAAVLVGVLSVLAQS